MNYKLMYRIIPFLFLLNSCKSSRITNKYVFGESIEKFKEKWVADSCGLGYRESIVTNSNFYKQLKRLKKSEIFALLQDFDFYDETETYGYVIYIIYGSYGIPCREDPIKIMSIIFDLKKEKVIDIALEEE